MALILHQFCKDTRQFSLFLGVWLALLALDLATSAGWVNVYHFSADSGLARPELLVGAQILFLWGLFLLLPAVVVLADSPARREGFLSTRPLSQCDWLLGKILFILVWVVLPAVVQEGIFLWSQGMSAHYVAWGVVERLILVLPASLSMAAFASFWSSYVRWMVGVSVTLMSTYFGLLLVLFCLQFVGFESVFERNSNVSGISRYLAATGLTAGVLVLLAAWYHRRTGGAGQRWSSAVAAMLVFILAIAEWPWEFFKVRPTDPVAAQNLANLAGFSVPLNSLFLSPDAQSSHGDWLAFDVNLQPRADFSQPGIMVNWVVTNVVLTNLAGEVLPPFRPGQATPLFAPGYYTPQSPANIQAYASILPAGTFVPTQNYGLQNPTAVPVLKVPHTAAWMTAPITLQAGLEGRIYRWDLAASLPLQAGKVQPDAGAPARWTYLGLLSERRTPNPEASPVKLYQSLELFVTQDQLALNTTADQPAGTPALSPSNLDFVLYQPDRQLGLRVDYRYQKVAERAGHTACPKLYYELSFSLLEWKSLTQAELDRCQLLVFRRTWLGTVSRQWTSPNLVLNELLRPPMDNSVNQSPNGLSRSELAARLAALSVPGPAAGRMEIVTYLLDVVRLMDATSQSVYMDDGMVNPLVSLVPQHLGLFLNGLPALSGRSHNLLLHVIARGAEETQKADIIEALAQDPSLASVLLQRGWVAAARPELYQLLDRPQALPFEAVQALAWFGDPATYPRLLSELTANPQESFYDLLRTLPGIQPQLDATIDQLWTQNGRVVNDQFYPVLGLALRAGRPDAFAVFWRMLHQANGQQYNAFELVDLLQAHVRLPAAVINPHGHGNESENAQLVAWCQEHSANDFSYDPVRQLYVFSPRLTTASRALTSLKP